MLNRRQFAIGLSAAALTGCASQAAVRSQASYAPVTPIRSAPALPPGAESLFERLPATEAAIPTDAYSYASLYGPMPDEPYPIPAVPRGIVPEQYWRRRVDNPFPGEAAGTIVIDPHAHYLHLVEDAATAMRYGVGVGRQGFSWSGVARLQFKRRWPHWKVPAEMIERDPKLEKWSVENGGMPPGLDNPLGARALYLFQNGEDTLYRIHGTPEAHSIGRSVSSGCIRMLNQDIIDLHARATQGATVVVRS